MPQLTPSQMEAWTKALDLLSEHFDKAMVAVETANEEDPSLTLFKHWYYGGYTTAIGMTERVKHAILNDNDDDE